MHACHAVKQYCAQTQMCRAARAARRREEKEEQSRAVESERTNERMNDYRGEWTCRLDADQASVAARLSACLLPTYLGSCRTTQVTDGSRTAASCASEEHTSRRTSRRETESKVRTDRFQDKKTRPCAAATADRHSSEPRHGDPVCLRHGACIFGGKKTTLRSPRKRKKERKRGCCCMVRYAMASVLPRLQEGKLENDDLEHLRR
ncbi:hypothetical protein HDK64DRAFT_117213 [Phyllosticta capitalensis]